MPKRETGCSLFRFNCCAINYRVSLYKILPGISRLNRPHSFRAIYRKRLFKQPEDGRQILLGRFGKGTKQAFIEFHKKPMHILRSIIETFRSGAVNPYSGIFSPRIEQPCLVLVIPSQSIDLHQVHVPLLVADPVRAAPIGYHFFSDLTDMVLFHIFF